VGKADAICAAATKNLTPDIEAAFRAAERSGSKKSGTALEAEIILPLLVRAVNSELHSIGALEAPSGDSVEVNALLTAYRAWLAKANTNPVGVVESNDMFNEARRLADKYGAAKCARSPLRF
jgi:hypothetical protein